MGAFPEKLDDLLDMLDMIDDRSERMEILISYSERFKEVPSEIASKPYPDEHKVQGCESQAYVWVIPKDGHTFDYHFAVLNPQGISAMAMAVILKETLRGVEAETILNMPAKFANRIFGGELSMGKDMGLTGMVQLLQAQVRKLTES